MHKEFLMGNEAIALGALAAGVNLVSGYPGTPSSEVLEAIAKRKKKDCYVEWSVNEKSAMEVAAGAAYTGARAIVTMKQMGLNVASDPLMCLSYVGVKGGLVVLVADDPGPISSQTEQDTRTFAEYSKLPCFDPSSAEEAYNMVQEAFEFSEKYKTPVFLRPTTRVCHGYADVMVKDEDEYIVNKPEGFIKDSKKWVIFPKLANENHKLIEERNMLLSDVFSEYEGNEVIPSSGKYSGSTLAVATGGVSFTYVMEAMKKDRLETFKVATPFPFPEEKAFEFLKDKDKVLCIEELDPVIERHLIYVAGKYHLPAEIYGKTTNSVPLSGENSIDIAKEAIEKFINDDMYISGSNTDASAANDVSAPDLPVRPPVLCAGCPHRASFYAVKQAMKGKKTIFCGDIGCYTLGNAMPLDMVDTCLCMGAGLGIAQGVGHIEPDTKCFAFVGDSTFFASAITGAINAVYNQADMTLIVLDNSTTAMTGHQPHPGTGRTMMGEIVEKIDIASVLKGIGVKTVETVNPFELDKAIDVVKNTAEIEGVKAIIFKSPCVVLFKPEGCMHISSDKCIGCQKCIREIGCPALFVKDGKVSIDESLCTGCGLCSSICPVDAINEGGAGDE